MSTPQNPYSDSDAENNQNIPNVQPGPNDQPGSDFDQTNPESGQQPNPPVGEQVEGTPSAAGSAQYGQGSQFSQAGQYNDPQNQYGQPEQYGQQNQFAHGGQYNQGGQYSTQNQYGQYEQPSQAQYPQNSEYAAYSQADYAGSQHAPVGNFQQPVPQQNAGGDSGFFKSLFDFRFDNFIAVRWAGFIYVIAIVVAVLSWLGTIVGGIVTGAAAGAAAGFYSNAPSFSPWPLLLAIIFGWIVPALWVIFVRLVLELIVANVKTAENTKRIAESLRR